MADRAQATPSGEYTDNSYTTSKKNTPGGEPIPVVSDEANIEEGIDPAKADTDAQLERDDKDAIDKANIIKGGDKSRTRRAPPAGTYTEPGDEEGLPGPDDGTSSLVT